MAARALDRRRLAVEALRRAAPPALRYVPAWHQARLRVALHRGERGSRWGQLIELVGARLPLPASLRAPVAR